MLEEGAFKPIVLDSTPAALSAGWRCMELGYDFRWAPFSLPSLTSPSGKPIPSSRGELRPDSGRAGVYLRRRDPRGAGLRPSLRVSSVKGIGYRSGDAPGRTPNLPHRLSVPGCPGRTRWVTTVGPVANHAVGPGMPRADAEVDDGPRDLRAESTSIRHLMTHFPKSPYCPFLLSSSLAPRSCWPSRGRLGCRSSRDSSAMSSRATTSSSSEPITTTSTEMTAERR